MLSKAYVTAIQQKVRENIRRGNVDYNYEVFVDTVKSRSLSLSLSLSQAVFPLKKKSLL